VEADDVNDLSVLHSRNKPLSKDELVAFGPPQKRADTGITVRPWATVKMIDTGGNRQRPVVFVGIKGTF
jgi:hypothetical protein